ncbi:hypothetical protein GJ744_002555 [Endocarpon pusillum]|uniref:Uncharacterized protein n=1 Tax=Endocarpon pusillum TaxID=364733 RepID=A0A8H7A8R7_9EURO|nr:hypothetical protein GJ744_002555 [Endocarpon pusillum]
MNNHLSHRHPAQPNLTLHRDILRKYPLPVLFCTFHAISDHRYHLTAYADTAGACMTRHPKLLSTSTLLPSEDQPSSVRGHCALLPRRSQEKHIV